MAQLEEKGSKDPSWQATGNSAKNFVKVVNAASEVLLCNEAIAIGAMDANISACYEEHHLQRL
jgi:hypothetical protein